MNLRHIEIFHAVYVNGSVSAAARALNVSQPSVSKMLRHAESLLGFQLFQRTNGGLVPTQDAHTLFTEVSEIQDRVHALREAGRNLRRGVGGMLRISALPSSGIAFGTASEVSGPRPATPITRARSRQTSEYATGGTAEMGTRRSAPGSQSGSGCG